MYPNDLKYTKTHEWVRREEDDAVSIGITEYAINELSDIIFLELPEPGTELKKDAPFGAVESVKAVFDLNSPVSGTVVETNTALSDRPETLNQDPYEEGWMVRLKMEDPGELDELLSPDDYTRSLDG